MQPMTRNLSDARLALHQRMTNILVEMFADADDYTDEDVDTAADIADELLMALGVTVVGWEGNVVTVSAVVG